MRAICEHCLIRIPADVVEQDDGVWLVKTCPTHGETRHLIEPDIAFYRMAWRQETRQELRTTWESLFSTTGLDVTRRCNVACPHCYVEPDNRVKDRPVDELIALAKTATSRAIILMGAEPTMRTDLAELIAGIKAATGKPVGIYTNGIRLADERYSERLARAGLDYCCLSLHTPDYLPDPRSFAMKVKGLENVLKVGVHVHHVSFSLRGIAELDGVLADGLALRSVAGHVRIRSPQQIGVCRDEPMHLSELYARTRELLTAAGHTVELAPSDNTPYHVNLLVNGDQVFRLIRWPTLASADLEALNCPPYALFDQESGEVNLVLSFLMQEARRNRDARTSNACA